VEKQQSGEIGLKEASHRSSKIRCRAPVRQKFSQCPPRPHLHRVLWLDAFQLPLVFQDYFLQVMQLCTGSDCSVHLGSGTRTERTGTGERGSRAKKDGGRENRREKSRGLAREKRALGRKTPPNP
jgi:hypothetical protein